MKSILWFLLIIIFSGCTGEDCHVYYNAKNDAVYLDTSDGRDVYFINVSLYAEGLAEASTSVDDTLRELKSVSFHEFVDTNHLSTYSINVTIKKNHEYFGKFYVEINPEDTGVVEIPPVYE